MAGKLRRWLREAAVFLALLIAIMVVMDVWRAPQAPPAFAATPLRTLTGESTTLATLSEERPVLRNRSRKNDPFLSHSERFDNNKRS